MKKRINSFRTHKFLVTIAFIAFIAFIIRMVVSAQLITNDAAVTAPLDVTDMATYHTLSNGILYGIFPENFYYQPFYYSVFLPVVKFIFRSEFWSIAIAQSLCGAGIVYLAGLCGAMLFGRKSGIVSSFLAAFSTMLVFYVPYALLEIQECLFFTLLFYLLLRAIRKDYARYWILSGIILSFAILSRGNAWCFLPVALLAAFYGAKAWKKRFLNAGFIVIFAILPQLPFVIYNSVKTSSFSGPSTAGPAVLAIGNNPEAVPGGLLVPQPEVYEIWFEKERSGDEKVVSQIASWAFAEPFAFLELQFRKVMLFFDSKEIPNNVSLELNGEKSSVLSLAFVSTGAIIFLAMASLFISLRGLLRKRGEFMLVLSIGLYILAAAAFYILARFRVPAIGLLCIMGGLYPIAVWRVFVRKEWKNLVLYKGGAFVLSLFIVYFANDFYQFTIEPHAMRLFRPDGVAIRITDSESDHLDNASFFNNNRDFIQLVKGVVIEKTFSIPEKFAPADSTGTGTITLSILSEEKTPFEFDVNGARMYTYLEKGMNEIKSPSVPYPQNGIFTIRITEQPECPVWLLTDITRNYNRTKVNGEQADSEAVIRLKLRK